MKRNRYTVGHTASTSCLCVGCARVAVSCQMICGQ